jgi:hypothetical protein
MKTKGSCLCNKIKFSFTAKDKTFSACHCKMCRIWGGGPAFAVESSGEIEFEGPENISVFSSSKWAERGFCKNCGTNLFYRLKNHDFCNFNLGIIDNHKDFEFTSQFFIDNKPNNYTFSNDTKNMTEKEVMDSFSP